MRTSAAVKMQAINWSHDCPGLLRDFATGKGVLFIGAGLSRAIDKNMPLWPDLIAMMADELNKAGTLKKTVIPLKKGLNELQFAEYFRARLKEVSRVETLYHNFLVKTFGCTRSVD